MSRKAYPSDVSDDEWAFVVPYLTPMTEEAPQRMHPLREVFNGLRWIIRAGAPWRLMPNDLPPWYTVFQQTQRRLAGSVRCALKARVTDANIGVGGVISILPIPHPVKRLRN